MRNTVHNNGVYFHSTTPIEIVWYRNVPYESRNGSVVGYKDTWKFLQFELVPDLVRMIRDVVESGGLISVANPIIDPMA